MTRRRIPEQNMFFSQTGVSSTIRVCGSITIRAVALPFGFVALPFGFVALSAIQEILAFGFVALSLFGFVALPFDVLLV